MTSLQCKPRVGDRIGFGRFDGPGHGSVASVEEPKKSIGTVKRIDGNICWYLPDGANDEARYHTCFIWRFTEGLNRLARLFDANGNLIRQTSEGPSGVLDPIE